MDNTATVFHVRKLAKALGVVKGVRARRALRGVSARPTRPRVDNTLQAQVRRPIAKAMVVEQVVLANNARTMLRRSSRIRRSSLTTVLSLQSVVLTSGFTVAWV